MFSQSNWSQNATTQISHPPISSASYDNIHNPLLLDFSFFIAQWFHTLISVPVIIEKMKNSQVQIHEATIISNILNYNNSYSLECFVNRPIPADKRAWRKENEEQETQAKCHSRPITGRRQLRRRYEVHQWTNHIEEQQSSICYNKKQHIHQQFMTKCKKNTSIYSMVKLCIISYISCIQSVIQHKNSGFKSNFIYMISRRVKLTVYK